MARTKVVKRKKGDHSKENMFRAILLHRKGKSLRDAAKECDVKYPTLYRYSQKFKDLNETSLSAERLVPNYEINKVFQEDHEIALKEYIVECALKFYGLSSKDVRSIAYQMAKVNNIACPASWEKDKMAGIEWLRSYKSRHPDLSLKKPEACSLARATAFNKVSVNSFFQNLKNVLERHPSFGNGCRIYNLDETATTTVHKPQKVLAPKGRHNICKITSGERGILVPTCAIVCAAGQALPPVLVFPRKTFKNYMMNDAPPGSLGLAAPSGWMNSELFLDVMLHFIKHTASSNDNPSLLIMDNHESHLSIEALNLAKKSGVTVLTLHPHTTAKMQPLDVGLNGPFKSFYYKAVDSWLMRNPGKQMTIYNVAGCVSQAYAKAMTPVNITSAFKKCGIFPFDPDVFTEIDFMPSSVTDREQPEPSNARPTEPENLEIGNNIESPSSRKLERSESPSIIQPDKLLFESNHTPLIEFAFGDWLPRESTPPSEENIASRSVHETSFKSPKEFIAPIKAGPRTGKRKPRKLGKSMVATDTPEKNQIEEERRKSVNKKSIKKPVFSEKKGKKKPKLNTIELETSSEEDDDIIIMEEGDSDLTDIDDDDDDDEGISLITEEFEKCPRSPQDGDYVLVLLDSKKLRVYYVAKIIEVINANKFFVSFMRLKVKDNMKFYMPLEPDLSEIDIKEIKMILPMPKINGSKLRNSTYVFPVRVTSNMKLR